MITKMTPEEILLNLPCDYCRPCLVGTVVATVHPECRIAWMAENFAGGENIEATRKTLIKSIKKNLKKNPDYFGKPTLPVINGPKVYKQWGWRGNHV